MSTITSVGQVHKLCMQGVEQCWQISYVFCSIMHAYGSGGLLCSVEAARLPGTLLPFAQLAQLAQLTRAQPQP